MRCTEVLVHFDACFLKQVKIVITNSVTTTPSQGQGKHNSMTDLSECFYHQSLICRI